MNIFNMTINIFIFSSTNVTLLACVIRKHMAFQGMRITKYSTALVTWICRLILIMPSQILFC